MGDETGLTPPDRIDFKVRETCKPIRFFILFVVETNGFEVLTRDNQPLQLVIGDMGNGLHLLIINKHAADGLFLNVECDSFAGIHLHLFSAMVEDTCDRWKCGVGKDNIGFGAAAKGDRKSTRLNSSHVAISYAVFCLKK